ncbi:class II fructose-1,6-bisphosphate aldolase [Alicyclobacillus sendaiensis]|uniref:Class II fructose-1,6-bisphosphate aldolase n=1 Tax=Alicyclobacillus sendaiensis PA2 TaxID=3029425 RepID=A0ABT6Y1L9_ALISE|nr:class II fructose-1,6-bisphosphate aldolase [Alicyclobacillus sendaiensis]MDI9261215.1 class II fructose-1,6-bisphosphate aldolase [Alicyclobacillus sendaiensis PA2]
MGLVSMHILLRNAKADRYAVGQFNVNGFEWFDAILRGAQEEDSPVIIGVSDRLVDYLGGFKAVFHIITSYIQRMNIVVPCVLHLDHAHTFERCAEAVDAGFTSVMIDGSHLPFEENVKLTTRVVQYAHAYNVSVEAEVGRVGGVENGEVFDMQNADAEQCVEFVKRTGVDALAVALGSVHGPYENPRIDIDALRDISERISTPLVLHGGSGIYGSYLAEIIRSGYSKVNVNTDCAIAWRDAVKSYLKENPNVYEPRTILQQGAEAIYHVVRCKIREFGSKGKARVLL